MSDGDQQQQREASIEAIGPEPSRRQRWRTQRLFDLAVTASGLEPRRVARNMGIDMRSLCEMRELPSLHYIARIAEVLGIDAASAAGVVGLASDNTHPRAAIDAAMHDDILRADLDDDASALDRLAERLASSAQEPGDLALSLLCSARAEAARGEASIATARARVALAIGIPQAAKGIADEMVACIAVESVLGEAWMPHAAAAQGHTPSESLQLPSSSRAATPRDACGSRAIAGSLACALLHEAAVARGRIGDRIGELRRHVADAAERGCERAVAWSSSIAGIAALRIRERASLSEREEQAAMSLFVSAQFAIDERIATSCPQPPMSLLRRRLRLGLHEWCDRMRQGEASDALLDEVDDREVKAVFVRFPRARPLGMSDRSTVGLTGKIFERSR